MNAIHLRFSSGWSDCLAVALLMLCCLLPAPGNVLARQAEPSVPQATTGAAAGATSGTTTPVTSPMPAPNPAASTPPPASRTPAVADAYLYIGWPNDGQVVRADRPLRIWFGLRNMGVAPRGVSFPNTGHHHLLIDTELPPLDQEIPSDRNHLHFGAGETETVIELPPGRHTLQLLMGDARHRPHDPPVMSKKIVVQAR